MAGIDAYTMLMLHCDGTDTSTTFTDSSTNQVAKTQTANGNAQIDTAQSKFGGASGLFDGTGDYLTTPDSADFNYGTGDFTIDFWVRFNTRTGDDTFYDRNATVRILLGIFGGNLYFYIGGVVLSNAWTPSLATWYHVAFVRSGTSCWTFVDGTIFGGPATNSSNITGAATLFIGANLEAGDGFDGWFDELRISKGIARWTANFTPPTEAYSEPSTQAPRSMHQYRMRRN